uniref:Uncharacterized protein n=1 Tax=Anguilla anguilla TaxID=7936 RepID=A0A0E9PQN5_ANGAN
MCECEWCLHHLIPWFSIFTLLCACLCSNRILSYSFIILN